MKNLLQRSLITVFIIVALATLTTSLNAQKLVFVFAHAQYNTPVSSTFKNNYNFGLGGDAGVGVGAKKTFLTGTIGYNAFHASSKGDADNFSMVPIKLGIRHFILPIKILYINADAGVGMLKNKATDTKYSKFTGDIGAGVKLAAFEFGAAYEGLKQDNGWATWFGFKAGWHFGL